MKIFKQIQNYTRTLSICLIFSVSATFTATLEAKSYDSTQMNCLALVGYHEAKGESDRGMIAVMQVTMNRVKSEKFANTICGVVHSPNQYSWSKYNPPIKEPKQYERAKRLAYEVVNGKHHDISGKALFFNSLHKQPKGTVCTVRIGGHSFYKPVK